MHKVIFISNNIRVKTISSLTSTGVKTHQITIQASTDHPTGITTTVLQQIRSSLLHPEELYLNRLSLEELLNTPLPPTYVGNTSRRKTLTEKDYFDIANFYKLALANDINPTSSVIVWLNVSRPTASRLIRKARDLGFLGSPAKIGLPGNS